MKKKKTKTELLQEKLDQLVAENTQWLFDNFHVTMPKLVVVNSRLKRALGRMKVSYSGYKKIVSIEMASNTLEQYTHEEQTDIFRHELIHYGLYMNDLPHRDNDQLFIGACNKLNVTLSGHYKHKGKVHQYECDCQTHNVSRRLRNFKNDYSHRCKLCKSNLIYKGIAHV